MKLPAVIGIGAACLVAGLAIGRWATPPEVREVEKIVEVEKAGKAEAKEAVATKATEEAKVSIRWRRAKTLPDGTRTEESGEQEATASTASELTRTAEVKTEYKDRWREVEKLRIVENRPDWLLSARAGVDVGDMRPVYAGEVGRRVLGGLFVTVSGDSRGAVMGGVTWAF